MTPVTDHAGFKPAVERVDQMMPSLLQALLQVNTSGAFIDISDLMIRRITMYPEEIQLQNKILRLWQGWLIQLRTNTYIHNYEVLENFETFYF